jgi:hypothetical protein
VQDFERPDGERVTGAPFHDHTFIGGLVAAAAKRASRSSLR